MGIDVQAGICGHTGFFHSQTDALGSTLGFRMRSSHVVSVVGVAITHDFSVNLGAASHCVLVFFQHQNGAAFAHHKTAALLVKGNGCTVGVFLGGQSLAVGKTGNGELVDGRLCAAGDHSVSIAITDGVECLTHCMSRGCTGGGHAHGGTFCLEADSNIAGSNIGNHHGDEEGRNALHSTLFQLIALFHKGVHAADTGTDIDTQTVRIHFSLNAAVLHGLHGGSHGVLGIQVGLANLALFHIQAGVKILHFGSYLYLAGGVAGVKAGDGANAVFAGNQAVPGFFRSVADGGDGANSGNHNSSHEKIPPIVYQNRIRTALHLYRPQGFPVEITCTYRRPRG